MVSRVYRVSYLKIVASLEVIKAESEWLKNDLQKQPKFRLTFES